MPKVNSQDRDIKTNPATKDPATTTTNSDVVMIDKGNGKAEKRIPLNEMIALAAQGKSESEIARILGCKRQNVNNRLKAVKEVIEDSKGYSSNEEKLNEIVRSKLVLEMLNRDIKKVNIRDLTWCYGVLFDKSSKAAGNTPVNNLFQIVIQAASTPPQLNQPPCTLVEPQDVAEHTQVIDNEEVSHTGGQGGDTSGAGSPLMYEPPISHTQEKGG